MARQWTVSYSADISETISFDRDAAVNRRNHERYSRFVRALGPKEPRKSGNRIWKGVQGELVADLLMDISVHPASRKARGDYLARYIRSQNQVGGLKNWTVALISNQQGEFPTELGGCEVYPIHRSRHPKDGVDRHSVYRIRRLVSPADEWIDLESPQIERALCQARLRYRTSQGGSRHRAEPRNPGGRDVREVRDQSNGLLLIYPLEESDVEGVPFIGFAASFPVAAKDTPVEYVVNTVYWQEEMEI